MVKGIKIQGYHEDKTESQAALERIAKRVSEVFPAVGDTLGNVFKPRRGSL